MTDTTWLRIGFNVFVLAMLAVVASLLRPKPAKATPGPAQTPALPEPVVKPTN